MTCFAIVSLVLATKQRFEQVRHTLFGACIAIALLGVVELWRGLVSFSPLILRRIVFVVPPKITRLFDRPVFLTTPSSTPNSCLMYPVWRRFVGREMETRN